MQINEYDLRIVGTAIPWEAIFALDIVIVSLTLFKAYGLRAARRLQVGTYDLIDIILWDGENINSVNSINSTDLRQVRHTSCKSKVLKRVRAYVVTFSAV